LITDCHILTACHCIIPAIDFGSEILLTFSGPEGDINIQATIVARFDELDACILSISEPLGCQPIPLSAVRPREGYEWRSFGYPSGKTIIGHRITGTVSHLLDSPRRKIDIDLSIDPNTTLMDYSGLSGAAVVSDNASRGIICLKLNGTLGAISVKQLQDFLANNGIQVSESNIEEDSFVESSNRLAVRGEFQETFEQMLLQNSGGYVFLEGAHGIGKTTFCNEFQPDNKKLFILGTYSFALSGRNPGAIYQAQPEVFFDWLSTAVSILITGKPSRKEDLNYVKLVDGASALFEVFSKYCETKNQHGILFLDGLNEAQIADSDALKKLLGLLPQPLPQAITIVLTAPNYQSVALFLAGKVNSNNVISLPPLSDEASSAYCWQELEEHRANPMLIAHICEKAQGHPLYLRYLIEYVNNSPEEDALNDFPILTGTIEEYYESLWQRLLKDEHSINLLAIMARLRWGIGIDDLTKILIPEERIAFTPTISRIRHLLLNTDTTTIYHPSFADFLILRTALRNLDIQQRLAKFCIRESQLEYCVLNRVFHLLHSDETDQSQAVVDCNQKWVDTCVTLGVEPDTLLFDIEKTLDTAANMGFAVEVIRLLLLSQRVSFRYNVLFAQSARLISEALIILKHPKEALKHVIRFNTLIIDPQEALQIAFCLIQNNYQEEALKILKLLHQKILEAHDFNEIELQKFLHICKLHLQTILFMRLADGYGRNSQVANILDYANQTVRKALSEEPSENLIYYLAQVNCVGSSYFLCFRDTYADFKRLKEIEQEVVPLENFLLLIICTLFKCETFFDEYNLSKNIKSLPQVFSDIEELIIAGASFDKRLIPEIVDSLIQLGAPSSTVQLISDKGEKLTLQTINIRKDNGVDVDFSSIHQVSAQWRTAAFLNSDFNCPLVGAFDDTNWFSSLEQLICALSWCEGKARLAKADKDKKLQRESLQFLKTRVLQPLSFSLAQRVNWQNSYAIPESIFPHLYDRITVLLLDCYPEEMAIFLDNLSNRAVDQLGLYTEGFREVMFVVFHKLTTQEIEATLLENVLKLLQQWKEHVICGVENRHELVPELLRLIPIFVKVGADEEADDLYRYTLSVSMGSSWYKEDQFSLMVSTLRKMPPSDNVQAELPLVAGYLERASGEMTFQRSVRYEKMFLIGELFRRKNFSSGCRYFKRQVCGSTTELLSESQQGFIDKPSPTVGMRHPGGALDEQQAILEMVRNSEGIDWRLRWTLLEIFQCGDERHFDNYVTEYARLINQAGIDASVTSEMINRVEFVFGAEIDPKQRSQFLNIFSKELNKNLHSAFSKFIVQVSTTDTLVEYSTETTSISQDSESTDREDSLYFPGTFGYPSAIKKADSEMREAEKQLKLRNLVSAQKQATKVLQILQDGGWSIWGDMLDKTHHDAENLLRQQVNTSADLIRFYAPLIAAERYDSKWKIAEHLITKIADLFDEDERSQLLQYAINHVNLMVGDATKEIAMFDFLTEESHCEASIGLFSFILWFLDHPQWLRRNKAAGMVAWLVNSDPTYLEIAVKKAFSMATGYSADILCGVLDDMSMRQPQQFWNKIFPLLDLEYILQNCKHVSRLAVLHRIAERAGKVSSTTGITVASGIVEKFRSGKIELADSDIDFDHLIPNWANCVRKECDALERLGLVTKELVMALEEKISEICTPLTIQENWNLENAVSTSFREVENRHLNRWEAKVRFALNTALFPYVSQRNFTKIESVLRVFNPSLPERTLIPGSSSLSDAIFKSISSRKDYSGAIGNKEFFFLNYYGMMEQGKGDDCVIIEILAIVVPSFFTNEILRLFQKKYFSSKELPNFNSGSTDHETCWHLKPDFAFFGSFTPAYPLPDFKRLIKAKDDDFLRINWRNGKSSEVRFCGRPIQEGCLLAVKRDAVNLPEGKKLAWCFQMNGKLITVVDSQNNRLI
jgi:hypothetical protein